MLETYHISEWIAGVGVASLLKIEGESSAELDGSSLPPLVVEGKILITHKYRGSQQFSRVEYSTQIYRFDTRGAKEYL